MDALCCPGLPVLTLQPHQPYWGALTLVCPWSSSFQDCSPGNSSISSSLHPGHLVLNQVFHVPFCQCAKLLSCLDHWGQGPMVVI